MPWPPEKGWKDELIERWEPRARTAHRPPLPSPTPADFAQETLDFG
ncbi:hypothetical protein [Streptomyces lydicus]|nr:hypothetical protein [Streptomyces lydicus]MDC7341275.1 hypothetical protein [Streptomyces lydicus]MDC7341295.1 hypothetical protein [Streptomyces lydicus]